MLLLGKETDTKDISGRVLSEKETDRIRVEAVENCIREYIGTYNQLSPMYSARKVKGKKLYEFAREGREVERPEKKVTIYDIDIIEICIPRVLMRVRCSKGTYIRTLCHDIGQSLGTGGCMERLLRKKVGCFDKENSVTLKALEQCVCRGELSRFLIPLDEMFLHLKKIVLNEKLQQRAYNGNDLPRRELPGGLEFTEREEVRVYDQAGRFIGIYQYNELQRSFQVRKMFLDEEELRG